MTLDRRSFMTTALAATGLVGLSACTTPNPAPIYPDLTFQGRPPLRLNVADLQIINEVVPPLAAPNVEHLAPVAPAAAVERWAADVLQPAGATGRGILAIRQGSIIEEKLAPTGGVKGFFTIDQSERYTATIVAQLDLFDGANRRVGEARAEATHFVTIAEDASLTEREALWYGLVEKAAQDFAVTMEETIRQELAPHLR